MRSSSRTLRNPTTALSRTFTTSRPSSLARMTLVGRVGTDPELVSTPGGTELVKYIIGHNHGPKESPQTSWFRVASFAPKDSSMRAKTMGLQKGYVSRDPASPIAEFCGLFAAGA